MPVTVLGHAHRSLVADPVADRVRPAAVEEGEGFFDHGALDTAPADAAGDLAGVVDRHVSAGLTGTRTRDVDDGGQHHAAARSEPAVELVEDVDHRGPSLPPEDQAVGPRSSAPFLC